jgi:hypothetical protein
LALVFLGRLDPFLLGLQCLYALQQLIDGSVLFLSHLSKHFNL